MYTLIDGTLIHTAKETDDITGKLADLKTTDKSNLVAAINDITISGNIDHIARQMITAEIQRSMNADNSVSSSIAMEVQRATEAENALNSKITNEIQERKAADNEVLEAIATKANAADTYTKVEVYTKQETDSILATKVYTKSETNALLNNKADKNTTYTKDEVDTMLDDKANTVDVYTKQETDNLLTAKANAADVYTKTAVNSLLASKANTSDVYSKLETNALLLNKANVADVYTKQETETKIEQYESKLIDDTTSSTTKTWSSEKIESKTSYPLGFIYMQLYNPTSKTWEKDPNQLGMTPASGCKWEEITSDFASFPYLKIGSGEIQKGHNAYHNHGGFTEYSNPRHVHDQNVTASVGGTAFRRDFASDGSALIYPQGCNTGFADINHRHSINYDGYASEQTVEVNASNMKIWKVVADT